MAQTQGRAVDRLTRSSHAARRVGLGARVAELQDAVIELQTLHGTMLTLITELKTDLSEHVHGGVTAGAANTSAGPAIAAATPAAVAEATPAILSGYDAK